MGAKHLHQDFLGWWVGLGENMQIPKLLSKPIESEPPGAFVLQVPQVILKKLVPSHLDTVSLQNDDYHMYMMGKVGQSA